MTEHDTPTTLEEQVAAAEDALRELDPDEDTWPTGEQIEAIIEAAMRKVVSFDRLQVECWAGVTLTDDNLSDLEDALPNSTLPETIGLVAESLGLTESLNEDEALDTERREPLTEAEWAEYEAGR